MKKFVKFIFYTVLVIFILLNIMIAFHAYKFTHFYDNIASSPSRPEKLGILDKAGAIFFGVNYAKARDTISADSIFHNVVLKTDDGLRIHAWLAYTNAPKGTIILFHGHGNSSSDVLPEALVMRKMGYSVMLVDFRAHGYSEGNTTTIGFREAEEVKLAYNYIRQRGEKDLILWGTSMGASTVCTSIPKYELKPEKVILEMPFGTLHEAATGRIKTMGLPGEPFGTLVTFWGGVEQGFWAFNYAPCESAKEIHCPVLLQWGERDPRVTKSETDCIYNNLSSPKKLVVYESAAHESLYKKEPQKWTDEVGAFLNAQ